MLAQVTIRATDLEASVRFYGTVLPAFSAADGGGPDGAILDPDGKQVEVRR
jgi:catechol 2,3-dioxygenase-like lactoylglutathione lyase family enzyme